MTNNINDNNTKITDKITQKGSIISNNKTKTYHDSAV